MSQLEAKIDAALKLVKQELMRAMSKHPSMHSPHEGYAVLQEEVDELWDEIKIDQGRHQRAFAEALQVAAMGVRYAIDMGGIP